MNKGFYIKNEDGSIQKANSIATPEGIFDELNKDESRVLIYEYAPNAILAWQRDELTEMVSLIMKNQEPLLSDLKEQVQAFL